MSQPPPFENKPQCHKCSTKFNIITRQHHCRNCGRSYCNACSKANIPLPHYRLSEPQRVCDECLAHVQDHYRNKAAVTSTSPPVSTSGSSSPPQDRPVVSSPPTTFSSQSPVASAPFMSSSYSAVAPVSSSQQPFISAGPTASVVSSSSPSNNVTHTASPATVTAAAPTSSAAAPAAVVRRPAAPSGSGAQAFGQFSGFGRSSTPKYDLSGDQAKLNDQCRDAIKNNDSAGVTQLLAAGADAKYVDHTGNSLLHLAAMFDRFDIAKALLSAGASLTIKNPAGETPLDIAPPAMQHKLQALATA